MSYLTYPEVKASGVEWLGDMPQGWDVVRLKFLKTGPFVYGANEAAELDDPDLPRFIRITDLKDDGTLRADTFRSLPEEVAYPYMLEDGDFLFARSGATVGKAFLYSEIWGRACFAGYLIRLKPNRRKVLPDFLKYYVQSNGYESSVQEVTIQATIQNVSAEKYGNFWTLLPPLPEQQQIAAFLDRKTSELDAVLAQKERQLQLLAEKRQALISQAVTRGLDPNAPLRPSGIPWLGDVPEHWEIKRLKFLLRGMEQGWSPSCASWPAEDDEWGVLKVGCVNGRTFNPAEQKALPEDIAPRPEYEIKTGDVLVSRANTRQLLGSASLVQDVRPKLLLCDKLYRLAIKAEELDRQFLVLVFGSDMARFQIEAEATGSSDSMQNIGQDTIRELVFAWPSIQEQQAIVAYLDRETARMDGIAQAVRTQIEKLREYRQALISAAVTGKIDVREVSVEAA